MDSQQALPSPAGADSGLTAINRRCSVWAQVEHHLVVVSGIVVHHYSAEGAVALADVMVFLVDGGCATQREVAAAFGCSLRTVTPEALWECLCRRHAVRTTRTADPSGQVPQQLADVVLYGSTPMQTSDTRADQSAGIPRSFNSTMDPLPMCRPLRRLYFWVSVACRYQRRYLVHVSISGSSCSRWSRR